MKKKEQISDELLVKYMSGKASSEEEEAVLQYLAENDEHLDDFLNMVAAVELQQGKKKSIENKNVWKRVLWTASAAAAIAVLVVVGVFAFHSTEDENGQLARQEQTEQSQSNTPTTVSDSVKSNSVNTRIKPDNLEKELLPAVQEPRHYADSALKKSYAQMIFPSRKLTTISSDRQSVTFRWRTDACKIHLLVAFDDGRVLVDEHLENRNAYKMKIADVTQNLNWSAVFTFSDGNTLEKNGEIVVESR